MTCFRVQYQSKVVHREIQFNENQDISNESRNLKYISVEVQSRLSTKSWPHTIYKVYEFFVLCQFEDEPNSMTGKIYGNTGNIF